MRHASPAASTSTLMRRDAHPRPRAPSPAGDGVAGADRSCAPVRMGTVRRRSEPGRRGAGETRVATIFPNCYRTRRGFHLRRLQVTLSAAKFRTPDTGARIYATSEPRKAHQVCPGGKTRPRCAFLRVSAFRDLPAVMHDLLRVSGGKLRRFTGLRGSCQEP
jgi:hypothetical protein